jgi:hypothetical protein
MQLPNSKQQQRRITCSQLPLAVYREVAAHLRQVKGINTRLIMRSIEHDLTEKFDYYQSQVAALEIGYAEHLEENALLRVTEILDYYAQRYSPWSEFDKLLSFEDKQTADN